MKMQIHDFKAKAINDMYDLREDWSLIEASIAKQYGIRIRNNTDMPWSEFCTLVSGLMPDTPLGNIVSIRCEKDPKVIKQFSPEHRKIHADWKKRQSQIMYKDSTKLDKDLQSIANSLKKMFWKGGNTK